MKLPGCRKYGWECAPLLGTVTVSIMQVMIVQKHDDRQILEHASIGYPPPPPPSKLRKNTELIRSLRLL